MSEPLDVAGDAPNISENQATNWGTQPSSGEIITSEATGISYTMGEKIGEGHFGLVYSCVDVWNNSLAAKVLKCVGSA